VPEQAWRNLFYSAVANRSPRGLEKGYEYTFESRRLIVSQIQGASLTFHKVV
jgi:hypothetical protein